MSNHIEILGLKTHMNAVQDDGLIPVTVTFRNLHTGVVAVRTINVSEQDFYTLFIKSLQE